MFVTRLCAFAFLMGLVKFKIVEGNVVIDKYKSRVYDQYGDITTLPHHKSTAEIKCICNQHAPCSLNDTMQLIDGNDKVVSEMPISSDNRLWFQINQSMKLGQYKCRSKNTLVTSTGHIDYMYRPCAPDETEWNCKSFEKEFRFCYVTKDDKHDCQNMKKCPLFDEQTFVCTEDGTGPEIYYTACFAFAHMKKPIYMTTCATMCQKGQTHFSQLQLQSDADENRNYALGEFVKMANHTFKFKSSCAGFLAKNYVACTIKVGTKTILTVSNTCGDNMELQLEKVGLYVAKLLCTVQFSVSGSNHSAWAYIFLVSMDSAYKIEETTENVLKCDFSFPIDVNEKDSFIPRVQWILDGKLLQQDDYPAPHEITHPSDTNGTYVCKGLLHFVSSSPFTHFFENRTSEEKVVTPHTRRPAGAQITTDFRSFSRTQPNKDSKGSKFTTSRTPKKKPNYPDQNLLGKDDESTDDNEGVLLLWTVVGGVLILVLIVLAILLAVISRRRRKKEKKEDKRQENIHIEEKADVGEKEKSVNTQAASRGTSTALWKTKEKGVKVNLNKEGEEQSQSSESTVNLASQSNEKSILVETKKAPIRIAPNKGPIRMEPQKASFRMEPKKVPIRIKPKKVPAPYQPQPQHGWFRSTKTLCGCTP